VTRTNEELLAIPSSRSETSSVRRPRPGPGPRSCGAGASCRQVRSEPEGREARNARRWPRRATSPQPALSGDR